MQGVPVILHVSRRLPPAPCGHLDRVSPGDGCRQAAQQDGKIVACARKSRISAADVRITARMRALCLSALAADDARAHLDAMRALDPRDRSHVLEGVILVVQRNVVRISQRRISLYVRGNVRQSRTDQVSGRLTAYAARPPGKPKAVATSLPTLTGSD